MQQWEYCYLKVPAWLAEDYPNTDFTEVRFSDPERCGQSTTLRDALDELGRGGWEMVGYAFVAEPDAHQSFVFKRPFDAERREALHDRSLASDDHYLSR